MSKPAYKKRHSRRRFGQTQAARQAQAVRRRTDRPSYIFAQARRRLTLLFSAITAVVLAAMTILYLYVAESALYDNSFASFQRDASTLAAALEQQTTLTRSWLSQTQAGNKYVLVLKDNGVPLSYTAYHADALPLCDAAQEYAAAHLTVKNTESSLNISRVEFPYTDSGGERYFVSLADIAKSGGTLEMALFMPLTALRQQIMRQRLLFLCIVSGTILLLSLFCWHFTALLLRPIEENQRRQVQFVAAASHELRTPLTVLTNCLSALPRARANERESFLRIMEKECFRMTRLLSDLLTLASADSHRFSLCKAPAELDTLLLDSFEAFEPLAREQRILLRIRLPEESLPLCLCDRERISQVLAILIQNAISYHQPEKENRFICLSLETEARWFRLAVADNGAGIPDEEKERIFERFYRADPARSKKSHFGLGLCIAREIAAAHGGQLLVADTPGGGSTFTLRLPLP